MVGRRRSALLFFGLGVSAFSWPVTTGGAPVCDAPVVAEVVTFVPFLNWDLSVAATSGVS
ncbi:hypothetical protein HYPSUDRAFT_48032 [Hypholoma sublateritium FD-334 SS-4]|uniref:Uncharacterized protein n=1 Tax=Hypholoma sublateritium (strain FD-334 SS-4) TaxID=945553 RepID=A0A0D2KMN6_HYPSF|nr:hypothetical protein HYPSUDRAFT_48032 [Hypholoma sublateritium FD-334 SS-4]